MTVRKPKYPNPQRGLNQLTRETRKTAEIRNNDTDRKMISNIARQNSVKQKTPATVRERENRFAQVESDTAKSYSARDYFGKDWDIVLQGSEKTRKIPIRIIAPVFTCFIAFIILIGPLRDFLAQQEEKRALTEQLAESKTELEELKQQVELWNDPSYIQAQARKRLGFVLPGQTLYYVSGDLAAEEDNKQDDAQQRAIAVRRRATPFYITLWKSIEIAGTADSEPDELLNPDHTPLVNEPNPEEGTETDTNTGTSDSR